MAKVAQIYDQPDGSVNGNQVIIPAAGATLVSTNGTQTMTNKTLTTPTMSNAALSGTTTGTYTLGGTPTISALIGTYETVAAAGSAISDAVAIGANTVTCLVTAADGTKGAKLPVAAAGKMLLLKNADAANAILKVYPQVNSTINALSANSSLDMAAKTGVVLFGTSATNWVGIPLLPS